MRTNIFIATALSCVLVAQMANAADDHKAEHGGQVFHAFKLEADAGLGNHDTIASWDFDGWIGTDENKLHLKSEGEAADGKTEQAEFWAMYSRNISTFWDTQLGFRYDTQPEKTAYLVAGFEGLAPYFIETEAHLFVSDEGDVSARLRQEKDFLLTQRLVIQPYLEADLYAQDVDDHEVGAGLSDAELGLQLRYEVTRKFAPYIDVRYERKFGETANIARDHGEGIDDVIFSAGLRLMF